MSTCIIDDDKILELKKYAEEHEITRDEFMQMYNKQAPLIGDREGHILYLMNGFRFVHSIENVPHTCKPITYRIRKLSGSVNNGSNDKYPAPAVMEYIANKLGFTDFKKCGVKINANDPIPNIEIHEIIK
jgi:hypothetical protein